MMRHLTLPFALWLAVTGAGPCRAAQEPDPTEAAPVAAESPSSTESTRLLLDTIRDHLVNLRFEQALAAIEALLGQPGLSEADRGEALVLRSQAHVAFGDLAAAERDYEAILRMRPGFVPDPSLTPKKATERYQRARHKLVGDLVLEVVPEDAGVTIDGRPETLPPESKIPLLAGKHVVRVERPGFDAQQQEVEVEADKDSRVEMRLVPNARTVILQTEPEDVEVRLDGVWIGSTRRMPGDDGSGAARRPARLVIENLSLGEHVFELSKPCYRTETIRDLVTVDLLDWSPLEYPTRVLTPARSTLVPHGGPEGAQVLVDGDATGLTPVDPIVVCPGEREVVVRYGERRIWSRRITLAEADEAVLNIEPRPNATLLGLAEWPPELSAFAERFNTTIGAEPRRGVDLSDPAQWSRIGLPEDVDLALAPRNDVRGPHFWLYSPALGRVVALDEVPSLGRPRWSGVVWGLFLVDSERRGPAVVALVTPGGPAARAGLAPGDRLLSLGGSQVGDAARARKILNVASASVPLDAEWLSPTGTAHHGKLEGQTSVRIERGAEDDAAAFVRAAWTRVDAASDPKQAPAALANLALLLSTYGRPELAVQVWKRVSLADRPGVGAGTVLYYLGRDLQTLGVERDAVTALEAAAATAATAFDDEGPQVAPAARDRLADLGVK